MGHERPVQEQLFDPGTCLPASIVVGPFGIYEAWLASVLGLTMDRMHAWHSAELGAPRDYSYRHTGYFYTAGGIRRVLELIGKADVVDVIEHKVPPPPPRPTVARDARHQKGRP